jgi:hypothetical protein
MDDHGTALKAKLKRVEEQLTDDFGDADRKLICPCFDKAVAELVPGARITDFLPVLTYRHARACVTAA